MELMENEMVILLQKKNKNVYAVFLLILIMPFNMIKLLVN